ncbi:pt repeat family protein [Colletotrichum truncatum]|uniref:Pt repeat family protein n=1 Tax=Colletotrichum truncatum TaxID=5467 RepID=A0ACC3Z4X6_COLTU|nr:pt repeat family protein [Colletotrichum truncatum]KAF6788585.1 pt repeat family protein [Colletotrichum truncatum]
MAEAHLVRPSTSYSGASGIQRRFLLSSPGRPRTATGHSDPKFSPTHPAGLAVRVCVKFQPSLDLIYERQYQASNGFEPTEEICQALLRRLTHCSNELLTRRDSTALERTIPQIGEGKPLRFELIYQIYRGGPEPWATKSYKSYQKYPLDKSSAMEVARSTDRIIGSFLKLHDRSFRWMHGKMRERSGSELEILKPLSNPVSLLHIPQSRFVDATQDWEFIPGYEITLHFRSRCKSRRQREWERTLTLKSKQSSPLTLSHGEDMAWVLSTAMQRSLDSRKMAFDRQHRSCNRFDFLEECHHSEQNAVHVSFQIRNQLGLDHRHLRREIDSNLLLFQDPNGLDCEQFVNQLEHAFSAVRDDTDKELTEMDDLRLTIYELSGRGWKAEKPFAVCLDSTACYSRRTIKAILDRVQTGVADILGGNDMSITLMVHKRGHLVLDKTLVARSPYYATGQRQDEDPETVKESFLTKLKDRIRSDISMVVKDTCSLSDCEPQNIRVVERPVPAANDPAEMEALPSSSPLPIPTPNGPVPDSFDGSSTEPSEPLGQCETLQNGGGVKTITDGVIDTVGLPQQPETPAKANAFKDQFDGRSSLSFSLTEDGETTYPSSSSAPSLIDGEIGTPRDSLLVTPTFLRTLSGHPQHFNANPNIADSETSDSELIDESLIGASTPTMQRFNGPRRFNLFGKGSHSVSRQSLVSTESESEKQSLVESEPATEFENVQVHVQELKSELSLVEPESAPAPSLATPEPHREATIQEPAFGGWLEYCCVSVDAEEPPVEPEPPVGQETPKIERPIGTEPVIVITPDKEQTSPALSSRPLEGFLEYAIETIVEEDEDDSDTEFHDADSIAPLVVVPSPSSFATALETGLTSPISLNHAASDLGQTKTSSDLFESVSPPVLGTILSPSTVEVTKTNSVVENEAAKPVPTSQVDACTSSLATTEFNSAPSVPETTEPSPVPEAAKPSPVPTEPSEPRLNPSAEIHRDPSFLVLNEAPSVSSEAPRTPTTDSVPSFSDKDETRGLCTPPLMTETEDSDYSEPSEPSVPFPDLPVEAAAHDDSKSLSLWTPSRASFLFDDSSESYFGPTRKMSIPRPLFMRPNSSVTSFSRPFSHKRQFSSPTAGFFGFQEPRRLDIGLRGALFGLAALQKHGKLERSSSQILLKLENDKGAVVAPGSHSNPGSRRNSEARGIGSAGVLGLGNAYAF